MFYVSTLTCWPTKYKHLLLIYSKGHSDGKKFKQMTQTFPNWSLLRVLDLLHGFARRVVSKDHIGQ